MPNFRGLVKEILGFVHVQSREDRMPSSIELLQIYKIVVETQAFALTFLRHEAKQL